MMTDLADGGASTGAVLADFDRQVLTGSSSQPLSIKLRVLDLSHNPELRLPGQVVDALKACCAECNLDDRISEAPAAVPNVDSPASVDIMPSVAVIPPAVIKTEPAFQAKHISTWTVTDVGDWLDSINFAGATVVSNCDLILHV